MTTTDTTVPRLYNASTRTDLVDWGAQPNAIEGHSRSSGRLVMKGPDNRPEVGIWVCTPGRWTLDIPRDELCHFVAGHAIYRREDGEVTQVTPGTVVMFPAGWKGECTVHATMRNLYILVE